MTNLGYNYDSETVWKVSDHLLTVLECLEQFMDSGSLLPDPWLNEMGYRMEICKQHVAIYKIVNEEIFVYHIADTRTGYTKLFQ